MMLDLTLTIVLTLLTIVGLGYSDDSSNLYEIDEEKLNTYKSKVCNSLPDLSSESGNIPKWSDVMTEEEVYELAFVNMGYGLSSDAVSHLPMSLGWKKGIIDLIAYIVQTTCDTDAVSNRFITTMKNLFLYYIVKYERHAKKMDESPTSAEDKVNKEMEEMWKEIMPAISTCSKEIEPISFVEDCGDITFYLARNGTKSRVPGYTELLDGEIDLRVDIIIDSIWWMFATTFSRCYRYFYPNLDTILLFSQRFQVDILSNFKNRWRGAGMYQAHFPIIFGPFDFEEDHWSIRKCANSAFDYEGIFYRHLVRPLFVVIEGGSIVRNYKTESAIGVNPNRKPGRYFGGSSGLIG